MEKIPIHKLGYIAGVVDLRGRLRRINNEDRKYGRQWHLTVETSSDIVARELCALTGVKSQFSGKAKISFDRRVCAEHCPEPHVHVDASDMPSMYRWQVSGVAAAIVLRNLAPYLMAEKGYKEFGQEILDYTPRTGQGSGAITKVVTRLTELGWEIPEEITKKSEVEA